MPRDRRHERLETFVTRVPPDQWGEAGTDQYPITRREWLDYVAEDDDLVAMDGPQERWKLVSHPEGEPLYFSNGAISIRRDDSVTIERLLEIAAELDAYVVNENGEHFEELPGEKDDDSERPRTVAAGTVRIDTEEERLRKRQCVAVIVIGMVVLAAMVWARVKGEAGSLHLQAGLVAFALSAWALVRYFKSVFVLEKSAQGVVVYRRNAKSTKNAVSRVELEDAALSGLELVWFPLKYPGQTLIQFHVRGVGHPWLVLYASGNEKRAREMMGRLASQLRLSSEDRTHERPAGDVPKSYLLTKDEEKAVSPGVHLFFVILLGAVGGLLYWLQYARVALAFFGLAVLFLAGVVWKRSPRKVPEKYRPWIREER